MKARDFFLMCVLLLMAGCAGSDGADGKTGAPGAPGKDLNDTPRVITFAAQMFSAPEDTRPGTSVGVLLASTDTGDIAVVFAAAADDDAAFTVSTTGVVLLKAGKTLDFEDDDDANPYTMMVTARAAGAEDVTQPVTVTVTNVLENEISFETQTLSVDENSPATASVGTLNASTVPAEGVDVSFALATESTLFEIDADGKTLKTTAALNYEAAPSHTLTVTASAADAPAVTRTVTVDVTDVLEITLTAAQTFSIPENAVEGSTAAVSATDPTPGKIMATTDMGNQATVTFSSTDTTFAVSETGDITLRDVLLDYEATPSNNARTVTVIASTTGAADVTGTVTVNVTNVGIGAASDADGSTAAKAYWVFNLAELQSIASGTFQNAEMMTAAASARSLHYKLFQDIDASATADPMYDSGVGTDVGNGFHPIGRCIGSCSNTASNEEPFTGSFDGAGFVISGLVIDRGGNSGIDGVGLFGYVSGSGTVIKNVGLVGGSITGKNYTGGLVGYKNGGTARNNFATGNVNGTANVGGLVGNNDDGGMVQDSFATGNVNGTNNVGGLVGQNNPGTVRDSYATGSVTGSGNNVGGLVGVIFLGTVQDSYATGSVDGTGSNVGELVGQNGAAVQRAYCIGDSADDCVGSGTNTGTTALDPANDLAALRALTCDGGKIGVADGNDAVFKWDSDGDGDVDDDDVTCAGTAIADRANFPWDFGGNGDLPVLNGMVGGVLDADAQRALVAFQTQTREVTSGITAGSSYTYTLGTSGTGDALPALTAGHSRAYWWGVPASYTSVSGETTATVTFTPTTATATGPPAVPDVLSVVIIDRDADGDVVGVYADHIDLTVAAAGGG